MLANAQFRPYDLTASLGPSGFPWCLTNLPRGTDRGSNDAPWLPETPSHAFTANFPQIANFTVLLQQGVM